MYVLLRHNVDLFEFYNLRNVRITSDHSVSV